MPIARGSGTPTRRTRGAELVLGRGGVLGVGAGARAEHLVPGLEPRHAVADGRHVPGNVRPADADLGPAQPVDGTRDVRQSAHHRPVGRVDAGGTDADEHLVLPDFRSLDLS
jgi:hypothetical protein